MKTFFSILLILFVCNSTGISQQTFDHSAWNDLLQKYVDQNGLVNYSGIKNDDKFEVYVSSLAAADLSELGINEKLAFYINAYNAYVVKNVIDHMPIDSPLKVDGFFKSVKFTVAGEQLTLDQIEHEKALKISPVFPHFGLVCAAKSCPKLIQAAYTGKNVNELLKSNVKQFLANEKKNTLDRKSKTLHLSQIFNWFQSYFLKEYKSIIDFVEKYLPESDSQFVRKNKIKIEYLEYDWSLNIQ